MHIADVKTKACGIDSVNQVRWVRLKQIVNREMGNTEETRNWSSARLYSSGYERNIERRDAQSRKKY